MKKYHKVLLTLTAIVFIIGTSTAFYLGSYYHAQEEAKEIAQQAMNEDGNLYFQGRENITNTAIIFYPGAKVEYTAYSSIMSSLAEKGVSGYLVEMPGNLAILGSSKAQKIIEEHPEIENWFLAGHSLGGAMAAGFGAQQSDDLKGIILLGAYSASDLIESDLRVLSIYGENDNVLNQEKYLQYQKNLPEGWEEVIIAGGNHAGFGDYGLQKGDGERNITAKSQQEQTVEAIYPFLFEDVQEP